MLQHQFEAQLTLTEVVLTPQSSAAGTGVGAGGVSINSNDSSEGAFERSDMIQLPSPLDFQSN